MCGQVPRPWLACARIATLDDTGLVRLRNGAEVATVLDLTKEPVTGLRGPDSAPSRIAICWCMTPTYGAGSPIGCQPGAVKKRRYGLDVAIIR
jgi:hypothetical protein